MLSLNFFDQRLLSKTLMIEKCHLCFWFYARLKVAVRDCGEDRCSAVLYLNRNYLGVFQDDNAKIPSTTARISRVIMAECAWINWPVTDVNAGKDITALIVKTRRARGNHVKTTGHAFLEITPFVALNVIAPRSTIMRIDMTVNCVKMVSPINKTWPDEYIL